MLIITSRHCRAAGMCLTPGVRDFCQAHGMDYRAFIRDGIDAELLIATGDAMALQVVAIARAELELANGQ